MIFKKSTDKVTEDGSNNGYRYTYGNKNEYSTLGTGKFCVQGRWHKIMREQLILRRRGAARAQQQRERRRAADVLVGRCIYIYRFYRFQERVS
jgi:hypothetical protein